MQVWAREIVWRYSSPRGVWEKKLVIGGGRKITLLITVTLGHWGVAGGRLGAIGYSLGGTSAVGNLKRGTLKPH